jgi:hypothetical protein
VPGIFFHRAVKAKAESRLPHLPRLNCFSSPVQPLPLASFWIGGFEALPQPALSA